MKKPLVITLSVLGAVALGLVIWFVSARPQHDSRAQPRSDVSAGDVSRELSPVVRDAPELQLAADSVPATVDTRVPDVSPVVANDEVDAAGSIIIGRVVDENGSPISGAKATLRGYKEWVEGDDTPRLEGKYDYRGWIQLTDSDGRFRFEVAVPTVSATTLLITESPFRATYKSHFGGRYDSSGGPLAAGLRDVGTIRLSGAGAISGRVVNARGEPLEGVELDVGDTASTTRGFRATTDALGTYRVAHVEPGLHGLEAELDGYLDVFRKPIEVVAGQETRDVDYTLLDAPTLSGHVESPDGKRIANIRVGGWPQGGGSGSWTDSEEDGTFVLPLPQEEPYTCEPELPGLSSSVNGQRVYFDPGTTGLVLVIEPDVTTRFKVIDADTGLPIRSFGIRILRNMGDSGGGTTSFGGVPRVATHADGVFETGARPGLDQFDLLAPDYKRTSGEIEHDEDSTTQTIRLSAGPGLRGRIVQGEAGVADVTVVLTPGGFEADTQLLPGLAAAGFGPPARKKGYVPEPSIRVDRERARHTQTAADGSFAFKGLPANAGHLLFVDAGERGVLSRWGIRAKNETNNLGDLALTAWARIEGRVIMPKGIDPSGTQLFVDLWTDKRMAVVNADAEFVIERIAPGPHTLKARSKPGYLEGSRPVLVELVAGETAEPVIDLSTYGSTPVTVYLTDVSGTDLSSWSVALERPPELPKELWSGSLFKVGDFNASGMATGSVNGIGPAQAVLTNSARIRFVPEQDSITLIPGVPVELHLSVVTGSVEVAFPKTMIWPENGRIELALGTQKLRVWIQNAEPKPEAPQKWTAETGLLFPQMPLGDFDVHITVTDSDQPKVETKNAKGWTMYTSPIMFEATGQATIEAGKTARVELR